MLGIAWVLFCEWKEKRAHLKQYGYTIKQLDYEFEVSIACIEIEENYLIVLV